MRVFVRAEARLLEYKEHSNRGAYSSLIDEETL